MTKGRTSNIDSLLEATSLNMAKAYLKDFMCRESIFEKILYKKSLFTNKQKKNICKAIDKASPEVIHKMLAVGCPE